MSSPQFMRRLVRTTIGASLSVVPIAINRMKYRPMSDSTSSSDEIYDSSIFQFNLIDIHGKPVNKSTFKDKQAFLIVNVAWLTNTNYAEMQKMYEKYQARGLEILAFPCNTFKQENGSNEDILAFTQGKGVTFHVMEKVDCGQSENAHPIFPFLCAKLADSGQFGFLGNGIKWNFTKFLCDANGVPFKRFGPRTTPFMIEKDLLALLSKNGSSST